MTIIKQADLIESVAAALQYISYYHPADYIAHLARAYEAEQSPVAKDAIAQILTNTKMSATGQRPICQDTGIVNVFLKIGMDVRWEGFTGSVDDAVNEGVRRGYNHPDNTLRASVVADPQFDCKNSNLYKLQRNLKHHRICPAVGAHSTDSMLQRWCSTPNPIHVTMSTKRGSSINRLQSTDSPQSTT